jgi:hypothetical protein
MLKRYPIVVCPRVSRLHISRSRLPLALVTLMLIVASCTSSPTLRNTKSTPISIDPDRAKIDRVLQWLDQVSLRSSGIAATGSLTVADDVTSQDANFSLKSKRIEQPSNDHATITNRVDSLSIEVTGPFGISVARFVASPEHYVLYNALQSETMEGPTDPTSLEGLTQRKGVTLGMLNDAVFGLAPGGDDVNPQDSVVLITINDDEHVLLIRSGMHGTTSAISLKGEISPDNAPIGQLQLAITKFERWNTILESYDGNRPKPAVSIRYGDPQMHDGVAIPASIEARAGQHILRLEYESISVNKRDMMVRIKLPKK